MKDDRLFSRREAASISGIPHRTLDFWQSCGLLVPNVPAKGTGSEARYSFEDVLILAVLSDLLDAGSELKSQVIETLRGCGWKGEVSIPMGRAADLVIRASHVRRLVSSAIKRRGE